MNEIEARTAGAAALLLLLAAILRVSLDRRVPELDLPGSVAVAEELQEETLQAMEEAELRSRPLQPGEVLHLNLAAEEELDRLPGIGPALAARIVAAREERGGFGAVEELNEVSGIGPAIFGRIRDHLTLSPRPP